MMSARRVILVFVKWPAPGQVKTRLAADVGDTEAVSIYRLLVERVAAILSTVSADEICVLFDPAEQENEVRDWLDPLFSRSHAVKFQAQAAGDLGARLHAGFESVFQDGPARVAAIGTDCIEIDAATFEQTWAALERTNTHAVFGPARDGGYYLIGLSGMQATLFTDIPWSTEETLPVTLQKAEAAGLHVNLLKEKTDIDTLADWKRIRDSVPNS